MRALRGQRIFYRSHWMSPLASVRIRFAAMDAAGQHVSAEPRLVRLRTIRRIGPHIAAGVFELDDGAQHRHR